MRISFAIALALAASLPGCGEEDGMSRPLPAAPDRIELSSSAFDQNRAIPQQFTCDETTCRRRSSGRAFPRIRKASRC